MSGSSNHHILIRLVVSSGGRGLNLENSTLSFGIYTAFYTSTHFVSVTWMLYLCEAELWEVVRKDEVSITSSVYGFMRNRKRAVKKENIPFWSRPFRRALFRRRHDVHPTTTSSWRSGRTENRSCPCLQHHRGLRFTMDQYDRVVLTLSGPPRLSIEDWRLRDTVSRSIVNSSNAAINKGPYQR